MDSRDKSTLAWGLLLTGLLIVAFSAFEFHAARKNRADDRVAVASERVADAAEQSLGILRAIAPAPAVKSPRKTAAPQAATPKRAEQDAFVDCIKRLPIETSVQAADMDRCEMEAARARLRAEDVILTRQANAVPIETCAALRTCP